MWCKATVHVYYIFTDLILLWRLVILPWIFFNRLVTFLYKFKCYNLNLYVWDYGTVQAWFLLYYWLSSCWGRVQAGLEPFRGKKLLLSIRIFLLTAARKRQRQKVIGCSDTCANRWLAKACVCHADFFKEHRGGKKQKPLIGQIRCI